MFYVFHSGHHSSATTVKPNSHNCIRYTMILYKSLTPTCFRPNQKHVGVTGCCNIIVNLILLCAFVGVNFSRETVIMNYNNLEIVTFEKATYRI